MRVALARRGAAGRDLATFGLSNNATVSQTIEAPIRTEKPEQRDVPQDERPWIVIVWNDPINLMSYVTLVFQKLFGYSKEKATQLMLDVHNKGKAVVSSGTREKAELDVSRLHAHGLWATMQAGLRARIERTRRGDYRLRLPRGEREALRPLPGQFRELLTSEDPSLVRLFPPPTRMIRRATRSTSA